MSSSALPAIVAGTLSDDLKSTSCADEERTPFGSGLARQIAHPAIPTQRVHRAGVHGHLARLAELGLVDP